MYINELIYHCTKDTSKNHYLTGVNCNIIANDLG